MPPFIDAKKLSYQQKIAVACCLVEKMLPNYVLFSELTGFGDANVLRNITSLSWESILAKSSKINFDKQMDKLEGNIPDDSQYEMYGVYPAIDCCVAIEILLSMLISEDFSEFESLQRLYFSTIESYLQLQSPDLVIDEQPLYQDAVHFLAAIDELVNQEAGMAAFKALSGQSEVSNLGLSLGD